MRLGGKVLRSPGRAGFSLAPGQPYLALFELRSLEFNSQFDSKLWFETRRLSNSPGNGATASAAALTR